MLGAIRALLGRGDDTRRVATDGGLDAGTDCEGRSLSDCPRCNGTGVDPRRELRADGGRRVCQRCEQGTMVGTDPAECTYCGRTLELRADGGRELVTACPECDETHIYRLTGKAQGTHATHSNDYRCKRCQATFDQPVERPRKPGGGDTAVGEETLTQMDPDELVTDGGARDVLIGAAPARTAHKRAPAVDDGAMCYWTVAGHPRQTAAGQHVWFAHDGRLHARGRIVAVQEGRLWFEPLVPCDRPTPTSPPPRGYQYIEPLAPEGEAVGPLRSDGSGHSARLAQLEQARENGTLPDDMAAPDGGDP